MIANAVNIASELVIGQTIRLVVTAGGPNAVLRADRSLAERTLEGLNVDVMFLGVDGVNASGATTHDEIEAQTNSKMVERAARVVVVCDSSKIGRSALSSICALPEIDQLITDVGASAERLEPIRAAGVEVVQV